MSSAYGIVAKSVRYLRHRLTSGNQHSIHSPQVFALYNALFDKPGSEIQSIYRLHRELKQSDEIIRYADPGRQGKSTSISVKSLARNVAKSERLGTVLHNLVHHLKPKSILELGSSLGLSALYQHTGWSQASFLAVEGAPELAEKAQQHVQIQSVPIELQCGLFDDVLPALLERQATFDYIYLDGHHQLEPSRRYYEQLKQLAVDGTVIVLDDIHWSAGMEQFWNDVIADTDATFTIDLFEFGIVILRTGAPKQHFSLRL